MPETAEIALPTRRASTRLGRALGASLAAGDLVLLAGELGAGKTFVVRAALRALGVPGDERVTSPTFSIVHEHEARLRVAHADLYRLDDPSELGPLGLREARAEGSALLVEWGLPYASELGGDALELELRLAPAEPGARARRFAVLRARGARSRVLLADTLSALERGRNRAR